MANENASSVDGAYPSHVPFFLASTGEHSL